MTKAAEVAVRMLDSMPKSKDAERDHALAENILLAYLRETGSSDVADAYDRARARVPFWYG